MLKATTGSRADGARGIKPDSAYAWYALAVLCLVYAFNSMDRYILSILSEDVKKSFSLTDAQLGFLHGTAFAIFYALFGFPIGRLADRWRRISLLTVGLTLWSLMTALGGLSGTLTEFGLCRAVVGVGEATAAPGGFSLVSDLFTRAKRGTAMGVFVGGLYVGSGLSLLGGGYVASRWAHAYGAHGPFGLAGWQVALLCLGLPGLLLAVWTATLREPARGLSDGVSRPVETHIWSRFFYDLCSVLPPLTFYAAFRAGPRVLAVNIAAAVTAVLGAWGLIRLTGDALQWEVIGFGYYAAFSAAQSLKHADKPTFALTWGSRTFVLAMVGFGFTSMINVTMGFWTAPLAMRNFHMDKAQIGLILGCTQAVCGLIGVTVGGRLSDVLLARGPRGRIWVGLVSTVVPLPFIITMCLTHTPLIYFLCYPPVALISTAWIPAGAATVQELVLPRMRGTATTIYFAFSTLIGSGLDPYFVGKISGLTHSLATGILWGMLVAPCAVVTLWLCGKGVRHTETVKWERAAASGEPGL